MNAPSSTPSSLLSSETIELAPRLGLRLNRIERAILGEPLASAEPPPAPLAPAALADAWAGWADRTLDARFVPFAGVPDLLSARWVLLAHCTRTAEHEVGGRKVAYDVFDLAEVERRRGEDPPGARAYPSKELSERAVRAQARRVVLDPGLPAPPLRCPPGHQRRALTHLNGLDVASTQLVRWVVEGPDAAWEWFASAGEGDEWAVLPLMRALAPEDPRLAAWSDLGARAWDELTSLHFSHEVLTLPAVCARALDTPVAERGALLADLGARRLGESLAGNRDSQPIALALALFATPMLEAILARVIAADDAVTARRLVGRLTGVGAVAVMTRIAADTHAAASWARAWLLAHPAEVAGCAAEHDPRASAVLDDVVRALAIADPAYAPLSPAAARTAARVHTIRALPALDAAANAWWRVGEVEEAAEPVTVKVPAKAPTSIPDLLLRVGEERVDAELAARVVASALCTDPARGPRPLVAAVRERMTLADRDDVADQLVRAWLAAGAPSAEHRVLVAAGVVGHDGTVALLRHEIEHWLSSKDTGRAMHGLAALAAIGTPTAMRALAGIGASTRLKKVRTSAEEWLDALAAQQGISPATLADRIVPDLGLDDRGLRFADYGARRFRIGFGVDGPHVHAVDREGHPTGKRTTTLPPARGTDDRDLVKAARTDLTTLRKEHARIIEGQTRRLAHALITGRRWSVEDHEAYAVRHPVVRALATALVWRIRAGRAATLVRVDDGGYVGVDDEPIAPPADAVIDLAHPSEMSAPEIHAWTVHLAEHSLAPPIEQLARDAYARPGALLAEPIGPLAAQTVVGVLRGGGWERAALDQGLNRMFVLDFHDLRVSAVLEVTGLFANHPGSGPQHVHRALVVPSAARPERYHRLEATLAGAALDATTLPPRVGSEVRRIVALLAEAGDV